jgi:hypothetical protein
MEQEQIPSEAKYTTLSHKWGGKRLIQLTTANYFEYTRQIDKAILPKTFLEAMDVTRKLGVFYLWIDSLCIMQDSVDDWQRESSLMSDVYSGSWCNIAATRAEDSDSGLYAERDPLEIRGCIVKDRKSGNIFKVEVDLYGSREWQEAVSNSALMGRGWVLQEATLAPRTLHFGRDRLFWQCPTQKASEDCPLELHVNRMRYYEDPPPEDEDDDKHFFGPPGWATIIHKYSRCNLSFPTKDKLVAISGIAKNYGIEGDYLAGLWRQDLLLQLTWRAFTGEGRTFNGAERPLQYQAPSWSWASINREVKYSWRESTSTRIQQIARIISTNVEPVSEDKFGQVSRGQLRIQGSLARFGYYPRLTDHIPNKWEAFYLGRTWPELHSNSVFKVLPKKWLVPCDIDFPEDLVDWDILYCMPIYYERESSLGPRCTVHGLILEPTRNAIGEFYRRGTILWGDRKTGGAESVRELEDYCRDAEEEIPWECYESRNGHKHGIPMYTITLV